MNLGSSHERGYRKVGINVTANNNLPCSTKYSRSGNPT